MLPLLIGVAALLVLSGGKKKKSSSNSSEDDSVIPPPLPSRMGTFTMGPATQDIGTPWEPCDPPGGSQMNVYAAYGSDGKCMVFWDASTKSVASAHIEAEMAKLSEAERGEVCAPGVCNPDPYAADPEMFCKWEDNPKSIEFVTDVIVKMYPQLSDVSFPMPYDLSSPFFPSTVWTKVSQMFLHDFCGFNPVE